MNRSHDEPRPPKKEAEVRQGKPCKRGHSGLRIVKNNDCTECSKLRKKPLRAGRVKCRRCKLAFIRQKGEDFRICLRCREHCTRCDIELTDETYDMTAKKRKQYICKACVAQVVRNTTNKENQRDYDLLRNYGITVNEYNRLLTAQNGVCWICGRPPKKVSLSVDHEHAPGERRRDPRERRARVRGLLCWHCNNAIAKFDDSPAFLRRAADYLEQWPGQKTLQSSALGTIMMPAMSGLPDGECHHQAPGKPGGVVGYSHPITDPCPLRDEYDETMQRSHRHLPDMVDPDMKKS